MFFWEADEFFQTPLKGISLWCCRYEKFGSRLGHIQTDRQEICSLCQTMVAVAQLGGPRHLGRISEL